MGQTAKLGWGTLALQLLCLIAVVVVYLIEHSAPGAIELAGISAQAAISTIGSIAVGGGIGGGMVTMGQGVRHFGTRAPTSAQLQRAENPPDPDADATVPS